MKILKNEEIIETLEKGMSEVANFIDKLSELKRQFERISNITLDNADPACEAAETLERLAILLSTLVIYRNEYIADPFIQEIQEKPKKVSKGKNK